MRNLRLTETQATKLFLYVAKLLNDELLPPKPKTMHYKANGATSACLPDPPGQPRPTFQEYVNRQHLNCAPFIFAQASVPN